MSLKTVLNQNFDEKMLIYIIQKFVSHHRFFLGRYRLNFPLYDILRMLTREGRATLVVKGTVVDPDLPSYLDNPD